MVQTPSIPLDPPYSSPLYYPVYDPPLRSLDYSLCKGLEPSDGENLSEKGKEISRTDPPQNHGPRLCAYWVSVKELTFNYYS